jgi:hypothetical protein
MILRHQGEAILKGDVDLLRKLFPAYKLVGYQSYALPVPLFYRVEVLLRSVFIDFLYEVVLRLLERV